MDSSVFVFELLTGQKIISEVLERGKMYLTLRNPMNIHFVSEQQLAFSPRLLTDPKRMESKLYIHSISDEYEAETGIEDSYNEYVRRLTSSIIQLDKTIKAPTEILMG